MGYAYLGLEKLCDFRPFFFRSLVKIFLWKSLKIFLNLSHVSQALVRLFSELKISALIWENIV